MRYGFKPYTDKGNHGSGGSNYSLTSKKHSLRVSKGERYPIDVIKFSNGNNKNNHQAQKPIMKQHGYYAKLVALQEK